MKFIATPLIAVCLALSGGVAFAQDTTKSETKMETKKAMSNSDCKEHMNTATGQKRTDPPTAETADKCSDMKNHSMMKKSKKDGAMMKESGPTGEAPAAPMK